MTDIGNACQISELGVLSIGSFVKHNTTTYINPNTKNTLSIPQISELLKHSGVINKHRLCHNDLLT